MSMCVCVFYATKYQLESSECAAMVYAGRGNEDDKDGDKDERTKKNEMRYVSPTV